MQIGPKQEKWLQALESGDYDQCRGMLYDGTGYCCLGVANKVLELNEVNKTMLRYTYKELGLYDPSGRLEPYIFDGKNLLLLSHQHE